MLFGFALQRNFSRHLKSQAGIEAMAIFGILFLFFILTFLFFLREKAIVERESAFSRAQLVVEEAALLVNSGNRIDGFYAEFQVPIILPGFSLNFTNYSVVGRLQVDDSISEIPYPVNATVYCSLCPLGAGVYWVSTSSRVTTIGQKS